MNKIRKWKLLLLLSVLLPLNVYATCDYETQIELSEQAGRVNVAYEAYWYGTGEFVEAEVPDEAGNYQIELVQPKVDITLYNLTEKIYVVIKNLNTNEEKTYYFADSNVGDINWSRTNVDDIVEYEIKVYSNEPSCKGQELRKINLVTPKYNPYHTEYYCEGLDEYYCQEFITTNINMSDIELWQDAKEKQEEKNEGEKILGIPKSFWDDYKWYILGAGVVVVACGATAVIIIKKRGNKVL